MIKFRSNSQGGEELDKQGNVPKLPIRSFDHGIPTKIHVGGNAIAGSMMKIENEA